MSTIDEVQVKPGTFGGWQVQIETTTPLCFAPTNLKTIGVTISNSIEYGIVYVFGFECREHALENAEAIKKAL